MTQSKSTPSQLDAAYQAAAEDYWRARENFQRVDLQLRQMAIGNEVDRETLRGAWRASARRKMRGISDRVARLNIEITTPGACLAVAGKQRFHVEHAVPVNLIHNRLLGIDRAGREAVGAQSIDDLASAGVFIRDFVIGVRVTPLEHKTLPPQTMPEGSREWSLETRMARYENLAFHRMGECEHCRRELLGLGITA